MNLQESIRADLNKLNSSSINEDEQLDEVWPFVLGAASAVAKYGPKASKAVKAMIKAANNNTVRSYSGKVKKMKTKERADGAQPSKEELDAASKWYKDAAKTSTKKNESIVEADHDENDQRIMQMLSDFRTLYKEMKTLDSSGYALDEYKERTLHELYHGLIANWFTIRSGKREGIPDLDGSNYNHPMD